nr:MAG TPA: hypothetical protein [Caudoviricetes sp.]
MYKIILIICILAMRFLRSFGFLVRNRDTHGGYP